MTPSFWKDKRVFLTGHTGFKGAWLSLWLAQMGARVYGYALPPSTLPSLFEICGIEAAISLSTIADIRDLGRLRAAMTACCPEIVIHMAAQPLVRESYDNPVSTYSTNVMGTVHVLEAMRDQPQVRACVIVTSDKCYENKEWVWGYRETDRLGGRDPYSNSKACAEMVVDSYRNSFFNGDGKTAIASARAGNVIGGGDWSRDRLVPDILRGCFSPCEEVMLRNPEAVRPWQHVLEPLSGYLLLAEKLYLGGKGFQEGWNFGPDTNQQQPVKKVAEAVVDALRRGKIIVRHDPDAPHEANLLQLDCNKARTELGWAPKLGFAQTIAYTADWYAAWHNGTDMNDFTGAQIRQYAALGADHL